jgi:hypothetical protein
MKSIVMFFVVVEMPGGDPRLWGLPILNASAKSVTPQKQHGDIVPRNLFPAIGGL